MKKFKSTWIMALVVAAIAGYTAYEYRKAQSEAGLTEGEKLAFKTKPENIKAFRILRGGEVVEVVKEKGEWKVLKPIVDDGEGPSIDGFVYPLLSQRIRYFKSEEEKAGAAPDWAGYGLDPAAAVFEVTGPDDKIETLNVSSKNAFDGSFYVRSGDQLLLGDVALAQLKDKPATVFRSRRLWRIPVATLISVRVENFNGKESFKLVKKEKTWEIEPKPSFDVNSDKIAEWIEKVQRFTPADFARETPSAQDQTDFLLLKPSYQISIEYKLPNDQAGMWTFTMGQDRAEDVFLYTTTRPTIYKTTGAALAGIRIPVGYFREGSKPFEFPLELVRKVEFKAAKATYAFKKSDSGWTLEGDASKLELDQERLVQLIQNVRTLEAVEFPAEAAKGLASPQLRLMDGSGKELFSIAWGDDYAAKASYNGKIPLRYVKTSAGTAVMGVAKDKIDRLMDENIVKEKSEAKK